MAYPTGGDVRVPEHTPTQRTEEGLIASSLCQYQDLLEFLLVTHGRGTSNGTSGGSGEGGEEVRGCL